MRLVTVLSIVLLASSSVDAKSLWNSPANREKSMYADRKANAVGDILLVEIAEETLVSRTSSKLSQGNAVDLGGVRLQSINVPKVLENFTSPSYDISGSESYTGGGSITDSSLIEAKVAVMVADVLPNGNLVIEGARRSEANGETQYIVFRGIVREDDIGTNNTVMSDNILNAGLEVLNEGDIARSQKKGWVTRLLDITNPY